MDELAKIVRAHHEKYDGSGYPNGLVGDHIPLCARVVAVADVYDALTAVRPYKKAWPAEEAFGYLRKQRGRHFDPHLVDAFLGVENDVARVHRELGDQVVSNEPA
jgi:putative two-component system response regulator